MADESQDKKGGGLSSILEQLPVDRLKDEAQKAMSSLGSRAMSSIGERVTDATDKLNGMASGGGTSVVGKATKEGGKAAAGGDSPAKGAVKGGLTGVKDKAKEAVGLGGEGGGLSGLKDKAKEAVGLGGGGGGGDGGGKATKAMNIAETIDVGVNIKVAYNQWTQYQDFSDFMKKVEGVDQESDEKSTWKAQVLWSHRTWEATTIEQVPDSHIVWRSSGEKGHVDGSVTFHELAPNLTRILLELEYYPQGLFERTGNLWRAPGRRARLEFKHFRRHVMTRTILDPDEVEGWRGTIRDSEVVESHEDAVEREEQEDSEDDYDEGDQGDYDDEPKDEDEDEDDESEDDYDEEPAEDDEAEDEEPADEYEDEPADEEEEPAENEEAEEEPADEYEEEPADEEEPAEDEPSDEEEEPAAEEEPAEDEAEEEPAEKPRPRRRRKARAS